MPRVAREVVQVLVLQRPVPEPEPQRVAPRTHKGVEAVFRPRQLVPAGRRVKEAEEKEKDEKEKEKGDVTRQ